MAEGLKRFSISVTPSLAVELKLTKQEYYCKDTQNEMIRDLIVRGLASLQSETGEPGNLPKHSTQKSVSFPGCVTKIDS